MPSFRAILQRLLLSLTFALFANAVSAMFIQPDWLDPTEPGGGTNRYAYSGNDPINSIDPNGNSCGGLGHDSGHCERNKAYSEHADDPEVNSETSFMTAASIVTWALGDADRSRFGQRIVGGKKLVASPQVRDFLETVGQKLYDENSDVVEALKAGENVFGMDPDQVSAKEIDEAWVQFEQSIVQNFLHDLKQNNPSVYRDVVSFGDASVAALESNIIAQKANPGQGAAAAIVRGQLDGRAWDFSSYDDRVMMGNAVTSFARGWLGIK
ncbi:hypothetical protein [Shimia sp.]|uniref:hypothetical protein n=1 Tax=Shimia sp. TaxID=1954381 RepID=UPI003B8E0215